MKRLHYIAHRLERWQAWSFHVGELGSSAGNDGPRVQSSRRPSDLLNKVDFDCVEIDMAVCELPFELKAVILAYYLYPEKVTISFLAGRLGITPATFRKRIFLADAKIAQWLEEHRAEKYLY